ncbi:peroxidase [Alcanivorax hongdengensis A-11-3]|uniref:Peroxidase n=1 Tax=Alcanivorax hongdengensis A-11-3 TaxID=1177179 RepID=L0WDH9_9GAMM|nr:alpha/beta hydrolase [Alcanivorax hongdengensis]EKF73835.1 peroxidase [Alcanivorax hongdengensis A-11-3]
MPFFATRDQQRLHVRIVGRGRPVMMIHGLGMQGRDWLPFVLPHRRRYQFFLPDLRGAGRSGGVRFNQADVFHNHMQDMEDLVAHFGLRDLALVGYSLGGTTSLHWRQQGDFSSVNRYLHVDQSPCIANGQGWSHGLFGERQADFFAELTALLTVLKAYPHAATPDQLPADIRRDVLDRLTAILSRVAGQPALHRAWRATALAAPLWGRLLPIRHLDDVRAYLQAYLTLGHDYRQVFADRSLPVTVLAGAHSPLYPLAGQRDFAERSGARLLTFEKSGHLPLFREPVRFTRALGQFLAA